MKRSTFVVAALLSIAAAAPAQSNTDLPYFPAPERYQHINVKSLERSFIFALDSDNNGVVESAIAHVARLKIEVPSARMERVKAVLGNLSVNGRTVGIRYRAYLAGLVFDDPALFAEAGVRNFDTSEQFFTALSGRLQNALLTMADRKYVRPE